MKTGLFLILLVFSITCLAQTQEREKDYIHAIAAWLLLQDPELEEILASHRRIIPFKETIESGELNTKKLRREIQIASLSWNPQRMIFVYPDGQKIKILFGAEISDEGLELGRRNSIYLLNPSPSPEILADIKDFHAVKLDIAFASLEVKKLLGVEILSPQRMDGRTVREIGNIALVDLELNPNLSPNVIESFLFHLEFAPYLQIDQIRAKTNDSSKKEHLREIFERLKIPAEEHITLIKLLESPQNILAPAYDLIKSYEELTTSTPNSQNTHRSEISSCAKFFGA